MPVVQQSVQPSSAACKTGFTFGLDLALRQSARGLAHSKTWRSLLNARNEASRQPVSNLHLARACLTARLIQFPVNQRIIHVNHQILYSL
jgi:hypothetical protein